MLCQQQDKAEKEDSNSSGYLERSSELDSMDLSAAAEQMF